MKNNTSAPGASNGLRCGWEPLPSEVWHEVTEHLPQPWTTGQASHDLRVNASEVRLGSRRKMPGRVYLGKRWGWTDRKVRALLRDEQAWKDPRFADQRTTRVPPAYQTRTTSEPISEVAASPAYQSRTTRVPPASTRADIHSTQITEHTSKDGASLRAAEVWKQVNAMRSAAGKRSWGLSTARRSALKGRIKEHGADAVLEVFQWFHTSPDAAWNRSEWKTPADTLLRPTKFLGYLEHAQTVAAAPKASQGTGSAPMDPETIWQAMLSVMGRVGGRRLPAAADAPELDPETFQRALAALGGPSRWTALCSTRPNDLHFRVRPTFVRMIQEVA